MYQMLLIISGGLAISLVYVILLYRKKSKPVSATLHQTKETIDIDSINDIVRSTFRQFGFENQNQVTDVMSFEAYLFDSIKGIKEKSEDAKYVETLIRLEPILHDLESLESAKWDSNVFYGYINNTIHLIEHTLGINRITDFPSEQLDNSNYWANYEPGEDGKVEKRYSPWMFGDEIIIKGVLQRRQDAT